jgi:hypothetical protein
MEKSAKINEIEPVSAKDVSYGVKGRGIISFF